MIRRKIFGHLILATTLGVVLPSGAFADARTDARKYFHRGMQAIQSGAHSEGADLLLKAYRIKPHPNVLYNVAKAYVAMGDLVGAIEYFEKYQKLVPKDVPKIRRALRGLRSGQRIRSLIDESARMIDAGRYEQGAALLQKAYNLRPRTTLLLKLARAQTLAHQLEQASSNYQAYLESRPDERTQIDRELKELKQLEDNIKSGKDDRRRIARQKPMDAQDIAKRVVEMLRQSPVQSSEQTNSEYVQQSIDPRASSVAAAKALETKGASGYEEVVVTASRRAQSPLDAPNAVTIISEEDIRLSGARSIPDLLRRVPGMDVMAMSYADWNVASRGFNRRIANKLLILVDGRTAYEDFLGGMLWSGQTHQLEDIARIEVVRGPGSAIYGANAYAGIVNIITKRPSEIGSTTAMVGGGNGAVLRSYFQHGLENGPIGLRFSVGMEEGNKYDFEIDPSRVDYTASKAASVSSINSSISSLRADALLEYSLPDLNGRLFAGAGIWAGYGEFYGVSALRNQNNDGMTRNARFGFENPEFSLLMFWNSLKTDTAPQFYRTGLSDLGSTVNANLFSVEPIIRPSFSLGGEHSMVIGAEFRQKLIDWNYLEASQSESFYAVYVQDSWAALPELTVLASYRLDHHPLIGLISQPEFFLPGSPRLAFIYKPDSGQAFRLSLGSAFRAPTQAESYLQIAASSPVAGVAINLRGGGASLLPEDILSAEVGYLFQGENGEFEAVAYLNRVNNLITRSALIPTAIDQKLDPSIAAFIGAESIYKNDDRVFMAIGSELSLRVYPIDGLDVGASYAYQYIVDLETSERFTDSPLHKATLWTQFRSRVGFDLGASIHFVSSQDWIEPEFDPDDPSGFRLDPSRVDSAVVLMARLGYRFLDDQLEFALSGNNLLDYGERRHQEHPFANRVEARLFASLTARF
jgi:iron complex outermembrane receptor protein